MSKKLKLSPSVSYLLGIYGKCLQEKSALIALVSSNSSSIEKVVKVAIEELGIMPNKLRIADRDGVIIVDFYNSKLRSQLDQALLRKTRIFRHKNAYAMEYVAGMFDASGGSDKKGLYIQNMDPGDYIITEMLGIRTLQRGSKHYVSKNSIFMLLISQYSMKLLSIAHGPGNERDPH